MKRIFLLLILISFLHNNGTAQCVQGNCTDGFGLYRTGQTYQLGNFKAGKADGEGMRVLFYPPAVVQHGQTNTEADFLLLSAFETPAVEAVLKLKPQLVIKGKFTAGELNGPGELWATDVKKLPELNWLLRFTERWIGGTWSWEQLHYSGEFATTKPSGYGSVKLAMKTATITCTGKALTNPDNPDVILEADGPYFKNKRIFRGSFVNGVPHGFAVSNYDAQSPDLQGLRRQRWVYGYKTFSGKEGLYPADELGAVQKELPDGTTYTGPLDLQQKPVGFGQQTKRKPSGEIEWMYTGYFSAGEKAGPGLLERFGQQNLTLAGDFSRDTFMVGTVYGFGYAYFWESSVQRYHPQTFLPMNTTGYQGRWSSRTAYEKGEKAEQRYWGGFNTAGFYEGQGTMTTANSSTRTGIWRHGNLAQQQSGEIDYYSLYENCVIVLNGMASPVQRDFKTGKWKMLTGAVLPEGGKVRLSKHPYGSFYGSCGQCNGSGKQANAQRVEAKTVSHSSSFSTITGGGYMDSYWKKTTTTTTSYTIPAYTTYTYSSCSSCSGRGSSVNRAMIPED